MNNNNNYIEFKQERDLGEIIGDTFKFIRFEWKLLLSTVFKIAAIPVLIALGATLYYNYVQSSMYSSLLLNSSRMVNPYESLEVVVAMFLLLISMSIAWVFINVSTLYYLKEYIENKGNLNVSTIKQNVIQNIFPLIGLGFLCGILGVIGTFLCVLPGVYLFVVFSLASSIYVFKEKTVMDTIAYAFKLIKDHWWETFGVTLLVGIIVGVLSYVFSIPTMIYTLIKMMTGITSNDPTQIMTLFSDPIYAVLSVISYAGKFLFYPVSVIATLLIYFDINEQKNASGTIEKIDNLGR